MPFHLLIDVSELGIAVWMLAALQRLDVGLKAEACGLEHPCDRRCRRRTPLPGQFLSQVPQRLGRPPQRRLRIAAFVRLDQAQQGICQAGIDDLRRSAAATSGANSALRRRVDACL